MGKKNNNVLFLSCALTDDRGRTVVVATRVRANELPRGTAGAK